MKSSNFNAFVLEKQLTIGKASFIILMGITCSNCGVNSQNIIVNGIDTIYSIVCNNKKLCECFWYVYIASGSWKP